jgi:hypothetical protein
MVHRQATIRHRTAVTTIVEHFPYFQAPPSVVVWRGYGGGMEGIWRGYGGAPMWIVQLAAVVKLTKIKMQLPSVYL